MDYRSTKWQAIAMQRGYPKYIRSPGTDKVVASVKTDASTGTGGVGQKFNYSNNSWRTRYYCWYSNYN